MLRRPSAGRRAWTSAFRRGLLRLVGAGNRRTRTRTPRHGHAHAAPPSPVEPAWSESGGFRPFLRRALSVLAALLLAAGVTGILVVVHRFLTTDPHFAVRDVRLPAGAHIPEPALRAIVGVREGDNLFSADLASASRRLRAHPWVAEARVYRVLPDAVVVDLTERQPAALVALGPLYLCDETGEVFKRAAPGEGEGLPVITGISRDGYVQDREHALPLLREALAADVAWRSLPRPPAGEIHVEPAAGVTVYTTDGLGVRLGRGDVETISTRLLRADVVREALALQGARAELLLVDQHSHPDRVTVRLAGK